MLGHARVGGPECCTARATAVGSAVQRRRRWSREGERWEMKDGPFCNFRKFQGPYCKTTITFKLGLKWKSAQHESCSIFQDLQLWCCAKIDLKKIEELFWKHKKDFEFKGLLSFPRQYHLKSRLKCKFCCQVMITLYFSNKPSTKAIITHPIQIKL